MNDAERKLWCAVLAQAHQDAEGTPIVDEIAQEPLVASRARHYLRADSEFDGANLAIVCEFAGIPADRLILWARQRFAQAA